MKQFTIGLLCAPVAALALALASSLALQGGMQTDTSFDVLFGALWTFVFVYAIGLQIVPLRDTLLWGAAYGFLGWFVGPLTVAGLLTGQGVHWTLAEMGALFPELCAYLIYGIALGVVFPVVYRLYVTRTRVQFTPGIGGAIGRGAVAGLVLALIFLNHLPQVGLLPLPGMAPQSAPLIVYVGLSVIIGALLGAILAQTPTGAGVNLIRGFGYGFVWWFLAQLTLRPVLGGAPVAWKLDEAKATLDSLLSLLLYGGCLALVYHLLTALQQTLFSDNVGLQGRGEGIGARNLRAITWGTGGALLGGLVFTAIMVQVGALPIIAGIVRGSDALTGLVVHFIISIIIGVLYALLFSGQATSYGSAAGWGAAYGLFWWVLGPVTLLPLLLGRPGTLTMGAAVAAYPASFIGHIAYGVVTAVYLYAVERREPGESAPRPETTTRLTDTAQSALWLLMASFVVLVPILLH